MRGPAPVSGTRTSLRAPGCGTLRSHNVLSHQRAREIVRGGALSRRDGTRARAGLDRAIRVGHGSAIPAVTKDLRRVDERHRASVALRSTGQALPPHTLFLRRQRLGRAHIRDRLVRLLEFIIGSTAVSFAVLLGTFMGWLCSAGLAFARVTPPPTIRSRTTAALEVGIGLSAILILGTCFRRWPTSTAASPVGGSPGGSGRSLARPSCWRLPCSWARRLPCAAPFIERHAAWGHG